MNTARKKNTKGQGNEMKDQAEAYTEAIKILAYLVADFDNLGSGELGMEEFMEGRKLDVEVAREILQFFG